MIEYYKNFSLEPLFYVNENGLVCQEEWKDIADYKDQYRVSNLGRAKSLQRIVIRKNGSPFTVKEVILKQWKSKGYLFVTLWDNGQHLNIAVSKLMWISFNNITLSGSKFVVDHKNNSQRLNNTLSNLELITGRKNVSKDKENKSSKYTGVCWNKVNRNWQVNIKIDKPSSYHLGAFYDENSAGRIYQIAVENLNLFNGNIKDFRKLCKDILALEQR